MKMIRTSRAFTLIELITVIAITSVLLSIIVAPLFIGFNFTRTAQAYSDAQSRARLVTEQISKEIGNATVVRDPNGIGGLVNVELPVPSVGRDPNNVVVNPASAGNQVRVGLPFSKLDLFMPAMGDPTRIRGGFVNPSTGKTDPTLASPRGQVVLPVAPGTTLKRFWVGLRDPFRNYTNPYDGLLTARSGASDNLYVLYVAEVEPFIPGPGLPPTQIVNPQFFEQDPRTPGVATPLFDDPNFFIPDRDAGGNIISDTVNVKANRIRNWLRRAKVLTEITRYDLITPIFDKNSRQVRLSPDPTQGGWIPVVTSLIQMRPSHVESSATEGQVAVRMGEETDNGGDVGPDVYRSEFGQWSNPVVRVRPGGYLPNTNTLYAVGRAAVSPQTNSNDLSIFMVDPASTVNGADTIGGAEIFNISEYLRSVRGQRAYPFSRSLAVSPAWTSGPPQALANATPFFTLGGTGKVITSFAIADVGNLTVPPTPGTANLPFRLAGPALAPGNDPTASIGLNINQTFNAVWNAARATPPTAPPALGEVGGAHRFIDLRVALAPDGTPGPLHPSTPFGFGVGPLSRARITPGSDEVFGPDQRPGPNFGVEIRYQRVNREPGPNEYRINYVDLPEPTNGSGLVDYSVLGPGFFNPPPTYTPGNLMSAVVQPRFKAGYVQLCSQPDVPIPDTMTLVDPVAGITQVVPGRIRVGYKFQFTNNRDLVSVDYDTRQLINVLLTVKNYPQSSNPNAQTVTLKATAAVRNYIR